MPYKLIDKQTGNVVGTYQKKSTAIKKGTLKTMNMVVIDFELI